MQCALRRRRHEKRARASRQVGPAARQLSSGGYSVALRACFKPRAAWWQHDVGSGRAFRRTDRRGGGAASSCLAGVHCCGCAPRSGGQPAGERVQRHRAVASRRERDRAAARCALRGEGCRSRRPGQRGGGYVRRQGRAPCHPGRRKARQRRCAHCKGLALSFSSNHAINRLNAGCGVTLIRAINVPLPAAHNAQPVSRRHRPAQGLWHCGRGV